MCKFRNYDNYEIYADGRIWSYWTNKFLKPKTEKNGYQTVCLYDNEGKKKSYLVHRVIYEAVSGAPIPEGMQVNHINEDKTDNRFFENLNLMSPKENMNWGSGIERCHKTQSKQVGAFKNGELAMEFNSIKEAHINGFTKSAVSRCCNGKLQHYKGFEWRFI